ncbi:LytTR family DNA-binding domain-containing protein [Desulfobotulus sp. H1]|uniref:LytTR family DNA-binding domain-containing protein n=1 Tax=Desulfobotulus pelophilus TaxID=2823377 RepID=A0ABT3N7P5_9BACT|nr:LytTR family DNA-binding domain-containing protein [Desulfobotulus pelophilus]MCW7753465.1 LytTR family DNA-binding domain-containing protein [Desulfobotulus pelophilus]
MPGALNTLSVLIVEDELQSIHLIQSFLTHRTEFTSISVARSGEKAIEALAARRFDLILLDIRLPGCSGIEVLSRTAGRGHVIFVTAHDRYALRAFEMGAVDYLLKPFSRSRFDRAIERSLIFIRNEKFQHDSVNTLSLAFRSDRQNYLVALRDILYLSSAGKRTRIHTDTEIFETPELLKSVAGRLPPESFLRVHRQFVVHRRWVRRLKRDGEKRFVLILDTTNPAMVPVGRYYLPYVLTLFETAARCKTSEAGSFFADSETTPQCNTGNHAIKTPSNG